MGTIIVGQKNPKRVVSNGFTTLLPSAESAGTVATDGENENTEETGVTDVVGGDNPVEEESDNGASTDVVGSKDEPSEKATPKRGGRRAKR